MTCWPSLPPTVTITAVCPENGPAVPVSASSCCSKHGLADACGDGDGDYFGRRPLASFSEPSAPPHTASIALSLP